MPAARSGRRLVSSPDKQLALLAEYECIAGVDEVGRGCLAGPVAVGIVAIDRECGPAPRGLADSKALSVQKREHLVVPIREWVRASAVGFASPSEIDCHGIVDALRLAGLRALAVVERQLADLDAPPIQHVLVDGSHNWLTQGAVSAPPQVPVQASLFDALDADDSLEETVGTEADSLAAEASPLASLRIETQAKADATCEYVSAASILAKVARDALMRRLPDPGYDWQRNKGYSSATHVQGLRKLGVSAQHRRSWKLPGVSAGGEYRGR